jgi:hypothetical protein
VRRATPPAPSNNAAASAQRVNNIVNYNAVKVNQSPGPVNRITPSGTQAMTPNAQSQIGRGLRTNPVPSPSSTNPNARYNSQGRNVNPTGDKKIAAGFDANQKRYQANAPKPKPAATTTPAPTARSWPGATRPAPAPAARSTATASAVSRPAPAPPPSRTTTSSSSSSTATSSKR